MNLGGPGRRSIYLFPSFIPKKKGERSVADLNGISRAWPHSITDIFNQIDDLIFGLRRTEYFKCVRPIKFRPIHDDFLLGGATTMNLARRLERL